MERIHGLHSPCKFALMSWSVKSNRSSAYFSLGKLDQEEGDLDSALKNYMLAAEKFTLHAASHEFVAACWYHFGSISLNKVDILTSM